MEPTRNSRATLVDLLDRVLDKGLVIDADLIVHVAGIPLLGLSLRAYLAGMETMLKYGIWQDWDEAQRAVATEEYRRKKKVPLAPDEEVLLETSASLWSGNGIYHSWRPGHLYITDGKVVLFRKEPAEVLLQCKYEEIKRVAIDRRRNAYEKETDYLYLLLNSGDGIWLSVRDAVEASNAIDRAMSALCTDLDEICVVTDGDEMRGIFASRGEYSSQLDSKAIREEARV